MAEHTKIAWCDCTFNSWMGCAKVSPGCAHCYAETLTLDSTPPLPPGSVRVSRPSDAGAHRPARPGVLGPLRADSVPSPPGTSAQPDPLRGVRRALHAAPVRCQGVRRGVPPEDVPRPPARYG
jgi:hypothetical protein